MSAPECTCRIEFTNPSDLDDQGELVHCPKHAAVDMLIEALEKIVAAYHYPTTIESLHIAKTALAAAKGEQP